METGFGFIAANAIGPLLAHSMLDDCGVQFGRLSGIALRPSHWLLGHDHAPIRNLVHHQLSDLC